MIQVGDLCTPQKQIASFYRGFYPFDSDESSLHIPNEGGLCLDIRRKNNFLYFLMLFSNQSMMWIASVVFEPYDD